MTDAALDGASTTRSRTSTRRSGSRCTSSSTPRPRCSAAARPSSAPSPTPRPARSASACPARCRWSTRKAVESAIRIGLALNCEIAQWCRFARKNYFYPDMPKNFQTSQYDEPIALRGLPRRRARRRQTVYRVEIERAHMEEDTGKSLHVGGATGRIHGADYSLVDYNRAGIPLIEIVTKPILGTGAQAPEVARAYVAELRDLLMASASPTYGWSRARCAATSTSRCARAGSQRSSAPAPRPRTSTRCARSSGRCATRSRRQAAILAGGGSIVQETRHWHEDTGVTTSGPEKSDAEDYRYFPEPDLVPVAPSREWVEELRGTLPEPPAARRARLQADWGFSDLEMRDTVSAGARRAGRGDHRGRRLAAAARKWWLGRAGPPRQRATGVELADAARDARPTWPVQALVDDGHAQRQAGPPGARRACSPARAPRTRSSPPAASRVVSDDGALVAAVDAAIAANPDVADKIRDGKVAAAGALIGQAAASAWPFISLHDLRR